VQRIAVAITVVLGCGSPPARTPETPHVRVRATPALSATEHSFERLPGPESPMEVRACRAGSDCPDGWCAYVGGEQRECIYAQCAAMGCVAAPMPDISIDTARR